MVSYITLYLLFFLQFIYFPIGESFFETPKVYLAQIGIFLLLLLTILRSNTPILKHLPKEYLFAFGGIVLLSVLHLIITPTQLAFYGNEFRMQGILLLWMLIVWAILTAKISLEKLLHPYLLVGCLVGQFIFALFISGDGVSRAIGTIGEPNALAAVVLFVWPFLYFTNRSVPQWVKLGSLVVVFLLIYITGSRSGMIAFILQLIFVLLSRTQLSLAKSVFISFLILVLTYALPFLPQGSIYEQRSEIWNAAALAGAEKTILGHGFGNTQVALEGTINRMNNNLRGSYVDSSHNIFLDWWVQGGLVGFGLFVFLLYCTFKMFIIKKKVMELTLLLGLLAALSFNPASIVSLLALWWLIGQGIVQ